MRVDSTEPIGKSSSWEAFDAGNTDGMDTIGYKGAAFDGRYVYFVPFRDNRSIHGKVLRYDTHSGFKEASSWGAFDAGNTDGLDTRGYVGAVHDERYVYFVPYSGEGQSYHARMLRYDTHHHFKQASSWSAVDTGSTDGLATRGYKYAAFDGTYIYFAPYHNGVSLFSGVVLRFNTKGGPWDGKTPIHPATPDAPSPPDAKSQSRKAANRPMTFEERLQLRRKMMKKMRRLKEQGR